jgi:sugar lactone lactonase YvrE
MIRLGKLVPTGGLALLGALLLAGCSGVDQPSPGAGPRTDLVWPAAPEVARIAYQYSVLRPADLGVKRSRLARFGQWLTGSEKGNERLVKPFGIAVDEADNLLLTDTGANVVCFYDRTARKWNRWDKAGRLQFKSPVAVAKRAGTIFVADSGLASIIAMSDAGKLLFTITNRLQRPTGLTISSNTLYVADSQRHSVLAFNLQGQFLRELGKRGTGPGEFNFPTHLASDSQGRLYVTDSMNGRVQVLDAEGRSVAVVGKPGDSPGHFSRPKGVAADPLGRVYVIDALFDNVQIFDGAGAFLLNLGAAGSQPGEFWLPNGIAIGPGNDIYVADTYNRRVQVFKYIGPS